MLEYHRRKAWPGFRFAPEITLRYRAVREFENVRGKKLPYPSLSSGEQAGVDLALVTEAGYVNHVRGLHMDAVTPLMEELVERHLFGPWTIVTDLDDPSLFRRVLCFKNATDAVFARLSMSE